MLSDEFVVAASVAGIRIWVPDHEGFGEGIGSDTGCNGNSGGGLVGLLPDGGRGDYKL